MNIIEKLKEKLFATFAAGVMRPVDEYLDLIGRGLAANPSSADSDAFCDEVEDLGGDGLTVIFANIEAKRFGVVARTYGAALKELPWMGNKSKRDVALAVTGSYLSGMDVEVDDFDEWPPSLLDVSNDASNINDGVVIVNLRRHLGVGERHFLPPYMTGKEIRTYVDNLVDDDGSHFVIGRGPAMEIVVLAIGRAIERGDVPARNVSINYIVEGLMNAMILDDEGQMIHRWKGGFFPDRRELL